MKKLIIELSDKELDYAVAKALGFVNYPTDSIENGEIWHVDPDTAPFCKVMPVGAWKPSQYAYQAMVIIENNLIQTMPEGNSGWLAGMGTVGRAYGKTLKEAAMRCFAISKLGETIDIPDYVKDW